MSRATFPPPDPLNRKGNFRAVVGSASGGCVLGLDHRIPNGTPLANYEHYLRRMWEYLDGAAPA